jgi:hypothetical protein
MTVKPAVSDTYTAVSNRLCRGPLLGSTVATARSGSLCGPKVDHAKCYHVEHDGRGKTRVARRPNEPAPL